MAVWVGGPAPALCSQAGADGGGAVAGVFPLEFLVERVDGRGGARGGGDVFVDDLPDGPVADAGGVSELLEVPPVGDQGLELTGRVQLRAALGWLDPGDRFGG